MASASTADLFERRWTTPENRALLQSGAVDALRARGATFFRCTLYPTGLLIMEGWYVAPSDQGEPPL